MESLETLAAEIDDLRDEMQEVKDKSSIHTEGVEKRLSKLEEMERDNDRRLQEIEESDDSPNIEPVFEEIERQQNEIQDIREGYQELGEMMQVILKELREQR